MVCWSDGIVFCFASLVACLLAFCLLVPWLVDCWSDGVMVWSDRLLFCGSADLRVLRSASRVAIGALKFQTQLEIDT